MKQSYINTWFWILFYFMFLGLCAWGAIAHNLEKQEYRETMPILEKEIRGMK